MIRGWGFVTTDPWKGSPFEPVSLNKYLYAGSNPVLYRDPSGLIPTLSGLSSAMGLHSSLVSISTVSTTAFITAARITPFFVNGMEFMIARGRAALPFLNGTGIRGVKALQTAFMNSPRIVSWADALKSGSWGSHSGIVSALNKSINSGLARNLPNIQYHHIVEQYGRNFREFGNAIHSMANVVPTPTHIHRAITTFYNSSLTVGAEIIQHLDCGYQSYPGRSNTALA